MIYLDYSATTPVDKEILDNYVEVTNNYIGNVNSLHNEGIKSKKLYEDSILDICSCLGCIPSEIIVTSGASESNSLALLGTIFRSKNKKHIITSKLEHKSILDLMNYLKQRGFIIDYVNLLSNGLIDLKHLEELINDDTILVSICGVNSETGYKQDLKTINDIIKSKNKDTLFHSDLTQALGKTKFDLNDVDMASFSSHKIYAPKGCGLLYKKRSIEIDKLVYGTNNLYRYRGGTPSLPLIVSFSKAIKKSFNNLNENIEKCIKLNEYLRDRLSKYDVKINSNEYSVPQIFNFSLLKMKGKDFVKEISKYDICVSSNSACASSLNYSLLLDDISNGNRKISETSVRVSISHLTTIEEIDKFIYAFDKIYDRMFYEK